MSSITVNQLNASFLGITSTQNASLITQSIEKKQEELRALISELAAINSGKNTLFTQESLKAFKDSNPDLGGITVTNDNHIKFYFCKFFLNHLAGTKQEEARNDAVIFVGLPYNFFNITIDFNRNVTFENDSCMYRFLSEYIHNSIPGLLKSSEDSDVEHPFGIFSRESEFTHPHALGTRSNFDSICVGNNTWMVDLKNAKTPEDTYAAFHKMGKWVRSSNLEDMYDSPINNVNIECASLVAEDYQRTSELVKEMFKWVIKNLYPVTLLYAKFGVGNLVDKIQQAAEAFREEFIQEIRNQRIAQTVRGTNVYNPYLIPFAALANLGDADNFSITQLVFVLNATYATFLYLNGGLRVYDRQILRTDLLTCMYTAGNIGSAIHSLGTLKPKQYSTMLRAPLALYDCNRLNPSSNFGFLDFTKNN